MTRSGLNLIIFVLFVSFGTVLGVAQTEGRSPLDRSAVVKHFVPHRDAIGQVQPPDAASAESEVSFLPGFSGLPYSVGATITPTSTEPEDEEHIAVDPSNFNNLVAMISDFSLNGGFNTSKFAVSTNNGKSWAEGFVPLGSTGFPVTSDGHVWEANSAPVVTFDKLGNVYLANLYLNVVGISVTNDGFYVCSATMASGPSFHSSDCHPVKTTLKPSFNVEDKVWIAADNSDSQFSGTLYASWTHFEGGADAIFFSRSVDHGVTWSKATQVSPQKQDGAVQGSQIAVGPGGQVYVAYELFFVGSTGQHYIAQSTDGGTSFSKAVPMTPVFNNLSFSATYGIRSYPALAVSPVKGKGIIYDVYTDQPSHNARTALVHSKSTAGLTFTAPISVNDAIAGQRLMPAVAVDSRGIVHTSWFDTRNSGTATDRLDVYATFSKDAGATFAPNARLTTVQVHAGIATFLGTYSGIAAAFDGAASQAHPVWTSGAFGGSTNPQLQTTTLTAP
jgi:hypothetical protein